MPLSFAGGTAAIGNIDDVWEMLSYWITFAFGNILR